MIEIIIVVFFARVYVYRETVDQLERWILCKLWHTVYARDE